MPHRGLLVLFLLSVAASAQLRLVADINTTLGPPASSDPSAFAASGASTYFAAKSYAYGRELWHFDAAGVATLAANIAPDQEWSSPEGTTAFGTGVVFAAWRLDVGRELWRLDGLGQGARPIADIASGAANSDPAEIVVSGGRIFCVADDGSHGRELWVSDGTSAGTHLVRDLRLGSSAIQHVVAFAGGVVLFADDGVLGRELWVSDGTSTGTRVLDVNPGADAGGGTMVPVVAGGRVFFMASDGTRGMEPWITDGTPAGTRLLADINPGAGGSLIDGFGAPTMAAMSDGRVLFGAIDGPVGTAHGLELWITDGTTPGTVLLRDIEPGPDDSRPTVFVATADGRAFFQATTRGTGRELCVTDGTPAGTVMYDVNPGQRAGIGPIAVAQNRAYFLYDPGLGGAIQLWTSDGTLSGTRLTSPPGMAPAEWEPPVARGGGGVVLSARRLPDGVHAWISDGTLAGTRLAFDVNVTRAPGSSYATPIGQVAGRVLLVANEGTATNLWATDGRVTRPLGEVGPPPLLFVPSFVAELNDMLVLDTATGLLSTDGTPIGTRRASPLRTSVGARVHGARAIWPSFDQDLMVTDGVTSSLVRHISDAFPGARMTWFVGGDGIAFFTANDAVHGEELWYSDGSAAGMVRDLQPPGAGRPLPYGVVGGRFVFAANDGTGLATWASDGTAAGTIRLIRLPTPTPWFFHDLTDAAVVDGRMVLLVQDGLMATDGTAAGTVRILTQSSPPAAYLLALADAVVIVDTSGGALRLFRTDGTAAGTVQVPFAFPSTTLSVPTAVDAHTVVFAVAEGGGLSQLIATDGTLGGTRIVARIRVPNQNLAAWRTRAAGGQLFFPQDDLATGAELWAVDLGASAQVQGVGCGTSPLGLVTLGFPLSATPPRLGGRLTLRAPTALPIAALALGTPPATPIAAARARHGCALFLDPGQPMVMVPLPGEVSFDLPANPAFAGVRLAAQAFAGPSAPLGFDLSNGVALTFGF